MEVKKISTIRIPPSYTEYYTLQRKYKNKCPNCKKSPLVFSEENRTLTVVCQTPTCKSNMEIVIPTYLTFDQLYKDQQQDYIKVTNRVLQEKFDLMFEYKKTTDLATLKSTYLQKKRAFEDTQRRHEAQSQEREKKKQELEKQREAMIQVLRTGKPVKEDLNEVLNEIHRTTYLKIGQDPVPVPEFERDILSYAM
jgi:hypothetical protein